MKMAESSPNVKKMLWEKEKLLVTRNFSFSHSIFIRLVMQTHKNHFFLKRLRLLFHARAWHSHDFLLHHVIARQEHGGVQIYKMKESFVERDICKSLVYFFRKHSFITTMKEEVTCNFRAHFYLNSMSYIPDFQRSKGRRLLKKMGKMLPRTFSLFPYMFSTLQKQIIQLRLVVFNSSFTFAFFFIFSGGKVFSESVRRISIKVVICSFKSYIPDVL